MKWVWTVIVAYAVVMALWWLVDPSTDSPLTRIWLGLTLVLYANDRIREYHK